MSVGLALALLSVLVFGFGLFRIIFPVDGASRKPGARIALIAVGLMCAGAIIDAVREGPPAPPADNHSSKKSTAQTAPLPHVRSAAAPADMKKLWTSVLDLAGPCDKANSAAVDLLAGASEGKATIYEAYDSAQSALHHCESSWLSLGKLEPPASIDGELRDKVSKSLNDCELAYFARKESLELMSEVLDGDERPSKVQAYKDRTEAAQSGAVICVAGLMNVGLEVGADISSKPS